MRWNFVIILLTFLLCSCSKNDNQLSNTTYYINSKMNGFIFQPNSYWIYQSDSMPVLDSTYIDQTNHGFLYIYKGLDHGETFEYYSLVANTSFQGKTISNQFVIERHHILINPFMGYPYARGPVLFSLDTTFNWYDFYPSKNKLIDSLTIGNNTFFDVQECKFLADGDTNIYYTVASIGIIRKITHLNAQPRQWDLIKWNIIF